MGNAFAAKVRRGDRQRTLDEVRRPSGRGGWRPKAGRKPSGKRVGPVHRRRVELSPHHPVHVTLRASAAVGRLRKRHAYQAARQALAKQLGRDDFRVVHVSIQHNHVHLIVEAESKAALARGMQGLCSSMARRLNRRLGRTGPVFAYRYDARVIASPRQARNCLSYVLNNWRRHREDYASVVARRAPIDPYSSGPAFDGWRDLDEPLGLPDAYEPLPTARATTWLLTIGWRRHGTIALRERPGPWDA
jgi:REP element-mobilizing transposase RayT